jgi:DNA (cytosine-5)-methyltransferase 1
VGSDSLRDRCEADHGRQPLCDRDRDGEAHAPGREEQQPGIGGQRCDVAYADSAWELQPQGSKRHQRGRPCDCGQDVENAECKCDGAEEHGNEVNRQETHGPASWPGGSGWWLTEPDVGRVADGVAARVDRLKAIGNGQVPQCAAQAWRILTHNAELKGGA